MSISAILLFTLSVFAQDPNLHSDSAEETEAGTCITCLFAPTDPCSDPKTVSSRSICELGILTKNIQRNSVLRDPNSRLDYFRNYQECKHQEAFGAFKDRYSLYVAAASRAFGIPQALLECLFFQESKWYPNARSATGALGLGQFIEGTADMVNGLIQTATSLPEVKKDLTLMSDSLRGVEKNLKTEKNQKRLVQLMKDQDYFKIKIRNRALNIKWLEYFDALKGLKVKVNNRSQRVWSGPAPREFEKERDAIKPAVAVGAATFLMAYNLSILKATKGLPKLNTNEEYINFLAILGGLHNRGAGKLAERLGQPPPKTYQGWIARLGQGDVEAHKHMENIKRCLTKNGKPPLQGNTMRSLVEQDQAVCK